MPSFKNIREHWVRPALFFGNNPISLAGGAITTASAVTMIAYWLVELFGVASPNPYLGIIFLFLLPAVFIAGLLLIPLGVYVRRKKLLAAGAIPSVYPRIDLNDPIFRHGIDIVLIATVLNLIVVAWASYRGAAYMDSPEFCGQSCHVMNPELAAYRVSAHSHVNCVECHIGSGAQAYFSAKVNGTKQLIEVAVHPIAGLAPKLIPNYPTPIPSPVTSLRPARDTCQACHTPTRFDGEKLLVKSRFADDEQNSESQTVLILHLGGVDSLSHKTGIHGIHLGHIEYISTDETRTTIPWIERDNPDGTKSTYVASALNGAQPQGERRVMDCIDCHNRASHTFVTPEEAINRAMVDGAISPELPFVHKKGLELLKTDYASEDQARTQISQKLQAYYAASYPAIAGPKAQLIKAAGDELYVLWSQNVFPYMKMTWGTHPNHIGHQDYPGCFRCHDGDHVTKTAESITQDCAACHNLLAVEEAKPKVLADLGIQQ